MIAIQKQFLFPFPYLPYMKESCIYSVRNTTAQKKKNGIILYMRENPYIHFANYQIYCRLERYIKYCYCCGCIVWWVNDMKTISSLIIMCL